MWVIVPEQNQKLLYLAYVKLEKQVLLSKVDSEEAAY